MNLKHAALFAVLSLGLGMAACEKKEPTPVEKATDGAKDALNMRDNEKLKDAGEDAADAVDNAAEGVKDAVKGE